MKEFLKKITETDFRKPAKRLIIIALAVILIGGALTATLTRTQISELATLEKDGEQSVQQIEGQTNNGEHGEDGERDDKEHDLFDAGLVTRPSTAAIIVAITYIVLCGLCGLAYWLMVAAWLYKASSKAGMNRTLWSILGLAFNVLAVIAFLIIRGRMTHCQSCGTWQKSARFCVSCGAPLRKVCTKCGRECPASDAYCPDCGTFLKENGSKEKKDS